MDQRQKHYTYDISKNVISEGEITDERAISQSIEIIILTLFKERFFNHSIGSVVGITPFNRLNESSGEEFLDSLIESINRIDDRVLIIPQSCSLKILNDQEAVILTLPYIIKSTGKVTKLEKKLLF